MMPLVRPAPGFAAPNAALGGWGMDKVTNGTEPRGEAVGAVPSVELLLNSQAFRERLEGARLRREAALARRHDAAPEAILAASRPWEQADPQEILRRRAQVREAPAKDARPAGEAGAGVGRSTGVRAEPEPPAPAGPKPGFGALAEAMARIPASTPAGDPASAPTSAPVAAPTGADASVIVLRPASKETVGATMARAAAAMALLAEAGAGADRRANPDRQAVPPVGLPAGALPVSAQPVVPRRGRALLAVGGFVLGLTAGAVLAWVFARPALAPVVAVPAPPVVASHVVASQVVAPPVVAPAATAPATAGHPLTGVIDVAARAPLLHAPAEGGAETGPAALPVTSPVTAGPAVRLAPAALPPVAAAPGPISHTPDVLVMSATRGATAPDVPAGPVTLQPPVRQAPAGTGGQCRRRVGAARRCNRSGAGADGGATGAGTSGGRGGDRGRVGGNPAGGRAWRAKFCSGWGAAAGRNPAVRAAARGGGGGARPCRPRPGPAGIRPGDGPERNPAGRGPACRPHRPSGGPGGGPALARHAAPRCPGPRRPAGAVLRRLQPSCPRARQHRRRRAGPARRRSGRYRFRPEPGRPGRLYRARYPGALLPCRRCRRRRGVLAGAAGAVARDFTSFRPSPPQGTLELWLEGGTGGPAAGQPSRAKAPSDPLAARSAPCAICWSINCAAAIICERRRRQRREKTNERRMRPCLIRDLWR